MANNINLSECAVDFIAEDHPEYPDRLNFINGTLTHPTLGELATVECIQMTRRMSFKNNDDFFLIMDDESQELQEFAVAIFDTASNVHPWLVDGGPRSGSGCWGSELSVGDMLYITELKVKDEFRRRGVGSLLLQKLVNSPHMGYRGIAYAWPTPVSPANQAQRDRQSAVITAFFRKNGFRRIGLTSFFAYAPDPSHPSHNIPASSDPDPPSINVNGGPLSPDQVKTQCPVHYALGTNKTPSVADIIRTAYHVDNSSVRRRDPHGFLPIHFAAANENVHGIRALMEVCPEGMVEDSKDRANKDRMTPLEIHDVSMQSDKDTVRRMMATWDGYSDAALTCKYLLTMAAGLPLGPGITTEEDYKKQKKYGCTCGTCTDGWLSPRLRFRLSAQAALQKDNMSLDTSQFKSRHPLPFSEMFHAAFEYIPPFARCEVYKTYYIGFATVLDAIHQILDAPGSQRIPTPQEVYSMALCLDARAVQFFIGKGGMMEYAIDATVDLAKDQSSLGDGTFEETFDEDFDTGGGYTGYATLPKCSNDLEFDVAKRKLGLLPGKKWGPYNNSFGDEEMDTDDDDDDYF